MKVAATPILNIAGACAYHTSLVMGVHEYYFDTDGIVCVPALWSHQHMSTSGENSTTELVPVGRSALDGQELRRALARYFKAGSYDVLMKNCNSFTEVAVYFLTRTRLEGRFSRVERLMVNTRPFSTQLLVLFARLAIAATGQGSTSEAPQEYKPNPEADGFSVANTIAVFEGVASSAQQRFEGPRCDLDAPLCNPLAGCYGLQAERIFEEVHGNGEEGEEERWGHSARHCFIQSRSMGCEDTSGQSWSRGSETTTCSSSISGSRPVRNDTPRNSVLFSARARSDSRSRDSWHEPHNEPSPRRGSRVSSSSKCVEDLPGISLGAFPPTALAAQSYSRGSGTLIQPRDSPAGTAPTRPNVSRGVSGKAMTVSSWASMKDIP